MSTTPIFPRRAPQYFQLLFFSLLLSLALLATFACGGGSSNGSNHLTPPPSFSLTASSSSLGLQQGNQGSVTISVVPANGFSNAVSLSVSGLPAGVNATFSPASTNTQSTLNLTAANNAAAGTATITISGASSPLTATTAIKLTINGFSISALPAALALQQGAAANSILSVSEAGLSGNVNLSASGVPAGVTASFNTTSTSSTSVISFAVSGSAATGTSTITITGALGSASQTVQLALTILVAPPPGSIQSSFFALNNVNPNDDPTADGMSYGAVGHPIRLAWPYIEQSRGNFDFSFYDQYAAIAPREGPNGVVAVMDLTLGMTPGWAVADQSTCRSLPDPNGPAITGCQAPPDNIQDWKDFITALVQHYNGSTPSQPYIKYYEIWNEWNVNDAQNGFWTGPVTALVQLEQTACSIIHAQVLNFSFVISPSTVGPAHSSNDMAPQQLQQFLNAGGGNCIDAVSFHGNLGLMTLSPYPQPGEGCTQSGCNGSIGEITNSYREIMTLNGLQSLPLFDTEGGFEMANITDSDQRTAWLAQFYVLEAGLFTADQLQWVSWFTWGLPGVPGNIETANNTPDPAGVAYNQVFDWLFGRFPAVQAGGACTQNGTIWTCNFTGSSNYQAEVIWDDSQTCNNGTCTTANQSAPSWAIQYRDLTGATTQITGSTIPVGLKPVILEN